MADSVTPDDVDVFLDSGMGHLLHLINKLKNLQSTLIKIADIKSFVMPYSMYSMAAWGSGLSSLWL